MKTIISFKPGDDFVAACESISNLVLDGDDDLSWVFSLGVKGDRTNFHGNCIVTMICLTLCLDDMIPPNVAWDFCDRGDGTFTFIHCNSDGKERFCDIVPVGQLLKKAIEAPREHLTNLQVDVLYDNERNLMEQVVKMNEPIYAETIKALIEADYLALSVEFQNAAADINSAFEMARLARNYVDLSIVPR